MWDCSPGAREEAVLRQGLLAVHPDLAAQVTASGTVILETKRDGVRPHGLGLLAATEESLIYFEDEVSILVFPWAEISDLKIRRKIHGRRIALSTGGEVIKFADDSGQLALTLHQDWLRRQDG
ncbi:MAG TPA: hypothetical protein VJL80_04380 [Aeromicrobium sp.]|nr:hypothetical protein [Aeromicrobium sp.]HKY57254.1 hypothetical protein [Aeromicrobium sp.]